MGRPLPKELFTGADQVQAHLGGAALALEGQGGTYLFNTEEGQFPLVEDTDGLIIRAETAPGTFEPIEWIKGNHVRVNGETYRWTLGTPINDSFIRIETVDNPFMYEILIEELTGVYNPVDIDFEDYIDTTGEVAPATATWTVGTHTKAVNITFSNVTVPVDATVTIQLLNNSTVVDTMEIEGPKTGEWIVETSFAGTFNTFKLTLTEDIRIYKSIVIKGNA